MIRVLIAFLLSACFLPAQYFQGHVPSTRKTVDVFEYKSEDASTTFFAVGYSNKSRTPAWTAFEIEEPGPPNLDCERAGRFGPEDRADPVITHGDYQSSGYSRGHMVPNAAMAYWRGCEGNKATFITSNIVPQLQAHNGGVWEALESAIAGKKGNGRKFAQGLIGRSKHVWVFAGPVFWGRSTDLEKVSPSKQIWFPTAFWKTVIWVNGEGEFNTCSWLIPHRANIPKKSYMEFTVSIQDIYRKTGVNVLSTKTDPLFTRTDADEFIEQSDD